ncbi:MAG: hypothetical protein EBS90_13035, partial [Betaproteobacteria bacterium]|nr:hypothetical protein [Betaproteobacteria bacterium]
MARKKNIESEIETPAFDVEAAIARAVETPAPSANSLSEEAEAIRQQLAEESAAPREATRPDISRLHDAVADGVPLFGPGDRIIIERRAVVLKGTPYLDTRTYRVRSVDPETGLMRLWDEALPFLEG